MFNRRLFAITGGREVPVPVDVPQASFVPIRNQWVGNNTEYNPTFEIPENVTRLGLYWHPCQTAWEDDCRLYRQVVRVDYFNWASLGNSARGTLRLTNVDNGRTLDTAGAVITFNSYILQQATRTSIFFFPCKVLYCGYNSEIEKLPITANIA